MSIRERLARWLVPELPQLIEDTSKLTNQMALPEISATTKRELEDMLGTAQATRAAYMMQPAIGSQEIAQKNEDIFQIDEHINRITKKLELCQ